MKMSFFSVAKTVLFLILNALTGQSVGCRVIDKTNS